MLMQGVGAFGRKPPESGSQNLALGSLQIIRIGDFHEVRRPPKKVVRFDEKVTVDRVHNQFAVYFTPALAAAAGSIAFKALAAEWRMLPAGFFNAFKRAGSVVLT